MRELDRLLEELSCKALLVVGRSSRDPFIAPFTGPAKLGPAFVVAPRDASPRLGFWTPMERDEAAASGLELLTPGDLDIVRWMRDAGSAPEILAHVLSRALHLCELAPGRPAEGGPAEGRLALAGRWDAGEIHGACEILAAEGWSFAAGEPVVQLLRKEKSSATVDEIRRVAVGAMEAFRKVADLLAAATALDGELWLGGELLRVRRLKREIAAVLARHELEQPEGGICAPGSEGAVPHSGGTPDRVLRPHESLVLDLYPRGHLFVDCTRTFCVGEPPPALAAAHARVREALELAAGHATPGRRGWSLQRQVCAHFGAAGYPTEMSDPESVRGYVHGLGHGVGFEVHEYPFFSREAQGREGRLETGDVITLEPGLYEPGEGWAVRLEDLYRLAPDGLENLMPLPYEMDPTAWD